MVTFLLTRPKITKFGSDQAQSFRNPSHKVSYLRIAQNTYCAAQFVRYLVGMTTYSRKVDGGRLEQCAVCHATVLAEVNCASGADANIVCASCGMTMVEPPFESCDYFDLRCS